MFHVCRISSEMQALLTVQFEVFLRFIHIEHKEYLLFTVLMCGCLNSRGFKEIILLPKA